MELFKRMSLLKRALIQGVRVFKLSLVKKWKRQTGFSNKAAACE